MFRVKALVRSAIALAIIGGVLFGAAGRYDLPFFWVYLALLAGFVLVTMLTVSRARARELLRLCGVRRPRSLPIPARGLVTAGTRRACLG